MSRPQATDIEVGAVVVESVIEFDRARLVRYAGASGDFNPIHWSDSVATGVGLPGVIAHGMLTMAAAVSPLEAWLEDPGAIVEYRTRFSRPVPVPPSGFVAVTVQAKVAALDAKTKIARFDLTVTLDGARVLVKAQVHARLG